MKKYISYMAATLLFISALAFAAESSGWRKIVWVDERGVEHTTLVSNHSSIPQTVQQNPAQTPSQNASTTQPPSPPRKQGAPLPEVITAKVVRVKSVDSIELADGKIVRYIGLQGPEPNKPAYKTSLAAHKKMVEGKYVNILPGAQQRAQDGSILAFVFINRLTFVNADLIRFGYAYAHPVEPNTEYKILFSFLQQRASTRKLGVWGEK